MRPPCGDPECAPHSTLALLGRPHVLDILYVLVREERRAWRFGQLQQRLGIATNILADRLRRLTAAGLLVRHAHGGMPPRVEYEAGPDALELVDAFRALDRWSARRHTRRMTAAIPSSGEAWSPA